MYTGIIRNFLLAFSGIFLVISVSGCSIALKVANPVTSDFRYASPSDTPITVALVDKRKKDGKFFSGKAGFREDSVTLANIRNEMEFLAETLEREIRARGLNAQVAVSRGTESRPMTIEVDRFSMNYYQPTGYNPFSVFTSFRGTVHEGEKEARIASYYVTGRGSGFRLKTSMSLTVEESFEILAKDIVSKMNRDFFSLSVNKSFLDGLIAKAGKEDPPACRAILDIAFTRSPQAVPYLNSLNEEIARGRIKSCIISALGFHGDPSFLPVLKKLAAENTRKEYLLALGAIGNIGTPGALEFLRSQKSDRTGSYAEFANDIVSLYTEDMKGPGQ